jgi:microcystin degradation protein MlrC
MRAFIGSIVHETNRFSPFPTRLVDYHSRDIGYEDLAREAVAAGCELVRGLNASASPSGPTVQADFETLRNQLLRDLRTAGELDLVLLFLHGAQVAEGCEDCESDIVAAVRRQVGGKVTIGVLLDLHASLGEALLRQANLVAVIKEYPHTDFPATARQLVTLCIRCARGEVSPVTAFVPLPLFTLWHTPEQPARSLVERARALEAAGEVLHISLVHGFPWSDVHDAGAAVLVTTDADPERAVALAAEFAGELWSIREADLGRYLAVAESLDAAEALRTARPVVIADAGDNPGAGTGGDSTWLLREVLSRDVQDVALALFWDPRALARIVEAGEGATLDLSLGGHTGELAGPPVVGKAEVLRINPAAHIDAMPGYSPIEVGRLAAVRIGGARIVVGAHREQVFGPRVFTEVGIDPWQQRILVVKSAQHFYSAFAPHAARVLYCDSPCARTVDFAALPFQHRRRPIWPLETVDAGDIPQPVLVG